MCKPLRLGIASAFTVCLLCTAFVGAAADRRRRRTPAPTPPPPTVVPTAGAGATPTVVTFPSTSAALVADSIAVPALVNPMDVKVHPAAPDQLWIANYGGNNMVVLRDPGTSAMRSHVWQDRAEYHYNHKVNALTFDSKGELVIACLGSSNPYFGMLQENYFMGPTVYEVFPTPDGLLGRPNNPVASIKADGGRCDSGGFPDCYLVHSDMLHESPLCMGSVHDPGAVTQGGLHNGIDRTGHVFFYSDGLHGELMRFDAESLHGPGILDHRTANIRRYSDVKLQRVEGVPGHMVLDDSSRIVYIADPGNSRVLRVLADGGEYKRVAQCVSDSCYPDHPGFVEGSCNYGYCTGGICSDEEGYGCYHIFTETADTFEYELWGCSTQDDFITDLQMPSGLAFGRGRLYVGEYETGNVYVYALDGVLLGRIAASSRGLTGLDLVCSSSLCKLYFANSITNEVGVVEVGADVLAIGSKPLERRICNIEGNTTRPAFNVSHGPGYQNSMVVKYSYGKHCPGFEPGEDIEVNANVTDAYVFTCPDRLDCNEVNGDAILMAGYLCHPCIPNPCQFSGSYCCDQFPLRSKPGFSCVNSATVCPVAPSMPTASSTSASANTTNAPTTTANTTGFLLPTGTSNGSEESHARSINMCWFYLYVAFLCWN